MIRHTVVDIFCGVGGISKGFEKAGYDVLLGIDNNNEALKVFKRNHPNAGVLNADIRDVTASSIRELLKGIKIDILVGGPPCQGFSMAGKRDPSDPRNVLFYEFARLAKELKPSWILIENVRGLASAKTVDGKLAIDVIKESFVKDFEMKHYFVNSADFGVPQKRKRIIFVGSRKKTNFNFELPKMSWKPVGPLIAGGKNVDKRYFYSRKLIRGFKKRERINRQRGFGFRWQFLNPKEPSYTIPARYWKDGANALVRYSDGGIRMLTERECAQIQDLNPKAFSQTARKMAYTLIGNAVPPSVIEPFAKQIRLMPESFS